MDIVTIEAKFITNLVKENEELKANIRNFEENAKKNVDKNLEAPCTCNKLAKENEELKIKIKEVEKQTEKKINELTLKMKELSAKNDEIKIENKNSIRTVISNPISAGSHTTINLDDTYSIVLIDATKGCITMKLPKSGLYIGHQYKFVGIKGNKSGSYQQDYCASIGTQQLDRFIFNWTNSQKTGGGFSSNSSINMYENEIYSVTDVGNGIWAAF
jgi:hypothetical protein